MSGNPRKFRDKIAQLEQRQAEGNKNFEQIIREVEATKSQPIPRAAQPNAHIYLDQQDDSLRTFQVALKHSVSEFQDLQHQQQQQYYNNSFALHNSQHLPERHQIPHQNHHPQQQQQIIYTNSSELFLDDSSHASFGDASPSMHASQPHQQHSWHMSSHDSNASQFIDSLNPLGSVTDQQQQLHQQHQSILPPMRARVASQGAYNLNSAPLIPHHHHNHLHHNQQHQASAHSVNNSSTNISASVAASTNIYLEPNRGLCFRSSSDSALNQQPQHGRWSVTEPSTTSFICTASTPAASNNIQQQQLPLSVSPQSVVGLSTQTPSPQHVLHHSVHNTPTPESVPIIQVYDIDEHHNNSNQSQELALTQIHHHEPTTTSTLSASQQHTPATTTTSVANSPLAQHQIMNNVQQNSLYQPCMQTANNLASSMRDLQMFSSSTELPQELSADPMIRCRSLNDMLYR